MIMCRGGCDFIWIVPERISWTSGWEWQQPWLGSKVRSVQGNEGLFPLQHGTSLRDVTSVRVDWAGNWRRWILLLYYKGCSSSYLSHPSFLRSAEGWKEGGIRKQTSSSFWWFEQTPSQTGGRKWQNAHPPSHLFTSPVFSLPLTQNHKGSWWVCGFVLVKSGNRAKYSFISSLVSFWYFSLQLLMEKWSWS